MEQSGIKKHSHFTSNKKLLTCGIKTVVCLINPPPRPRVQRSRRPTHCPFFCCHFMLHHSRGETGTHCLFEFQLHWVNYVVGFRNLWFLQCVWSSVSSHWLSTIGPNHFKSLCFWLVFARLIVGLILILNDLYLSSFRVFKAFFTLPSPCKIFVQQPYHYCVNKI